MLRVRSRRGYALYKDRIYLKSIKSRGVQSHSNLHLPFFAFSVCSQLRNALFKRITTAAQENTRRSHGSPIDVVVVRLTYLQQALSVYSSKAQLRWAVSR